MRWIGLLLVATPLCGCASHPRAKNPYPEIYRIVVVPFSDHSASADGVPTEQITQLFGSELQKTPTFEVLPHALVRERTLGDGVAIDNPRHAVEIAREFRADAVVIGEVTEYDAYYPPRLGLRVAMYLLGPQDFASENALYLSESDAGAVKGTEFTGERDPPTPLIQKIPWLAPLATCQNSQETGGGIRPFDPFVVRYSRVFDGANSGFVKRLRNYYFFRDDLRGGATQGYLDRTEDFHRFACNRMIYEMLQATGGHWDKLRGLHCPKPWDPWPWR